MHLRRIDGIASIDAAAWNKLFSPDDPFTRHEFLSALECGGCAVRERGWQPAHALLESDDGGLLAAAPCYLKAHSWGEFVFDFSWAQAATHLGLRYYPKWLCAIPFTPVTGPRLGAASPSARRQLARGLITQAKASGCSSVHALFLQTADAAALREAGTVLRHDVQFHWHNRGYADFSGFLAGLSSAKRKKILRERRRVSEAGLTHRWERGEELSEAQWAQVYALYCNTYEERGQPPYLSLEFFLGYARAPGSPVRLLSAFADEARVAVAITWLGGDTLYGRHWGAAEHYHSLHFETCYYQGIEFCIAERLSHFDAGAQGAHKLARGFVPQITTSAHWLADARLHTAVEQAMARERNLIADHAELLQRHAPYRRIAAEPGDG
ncbi:MAG: GNAT family N-acetyltransferase [Gammaproteobacteria bacterium]|nr:GNAT family N-acetyltransferase [Gammaproteobacteria bacterium]